MGSDLSNILKIQRLSDDHIQFLVYQILRALKVKRFLFLLPNIYCLFSLTVFITI